MIQFPQLASAPFVRAATASKHWSAMSCETLSASWPNSVVDCLCLLWQPQPLPPKKTVLSSQKNITGITSNKHFKNVTRQKRACVNSSFFGWRFHRMLYDAASSKGPLPFTMINAWRISRLNPGSEPGKKQLKTAWVVSVTIIEITPIWVVTSHLKTNMLVSALASIGRARRIQHLASLITTSWFMCPHQSTLNPRIRSTISITS